MNSVDRGGLIWDYICISALILGYFLDSTSLTTGGTLSGEVSLNKEQDCAAEDGSSK